MTQRAVVGALGQVTRTQAKVFLVAQSLVGFVVLIQFNWTAIAVGIASLAVVAIYPFAKRFTDWPQLFLGLAFSWGAFMGWVAVHGSLGPTPVLLYLGCILWTIGYDTIYAHRDKEDDALVGVEDGVAASREVRREVGPEGPVGHVLAGEHVEGVGVEHVERHAGGVDADRDEALVLVAQDRGAHPAEVTSDDPGLPRVEDVAVGVGVGHRGVAVDVAVGVGRELR